MTVIIIIIYPCCLLELLFDDGVIAAFNLPSRVRDHRLGVQDHLCSAEVKGLDLAILPKRESRHQCALRTVIHGVCGCYRYLLNALAVYIVQ